MYTGNVHDTEGATTHCPACGAPLIRIQVDLFVSRPIIEVLTETRSSKAKVGRQNDHVSQMGLLVEA
ncbi:hypothetical protein CO2235_130008 [Cupriavidus oxalaticus]|uniref:Uncharacterized protein n=1 Tax=Cupriavidus oxalaticus TaxID=96344 RepID=A0A375FSU0_9BURK|nr:hypothetical protein CO2235_U1070009 [Cupriavidus oxalaticus]SPC10551.1 hypothetical protein CO2235_U950024 [Cupriavidus oxalaticus]SPC12191.1 hypothetical protein CO2235_130008 [Cupriavidus oxalaticus]